MRLPRPSQSITAVILTFISMSPEALAHRDDYIDETFVYSTLAKSEFEIEAWFEHRVTSDHETQVWSTAAFEYGVMSRWTLDGAVQLVELGDGFKMGRVRLETRYRFAEEGTEPVDLATSLEYERESALSPSDNIDQTLTLRLVLSKDIIPAFNTTTNLDMQIPLEARSKTSLAYAVAVRYPAQGFLRVGTEYKGHPAEHTAVLFPQLWFALPHELTFKTGVGMGLTKQRDRSIIRFVLEMEL